jgi:hypothetical protein
MSTGIRGRRLVVALYLGIVAFSGVIGYLAASVVDGITPPPFLFLIEFPATRLGLAAYGALTIGLFLGVLLWLVTVVSERVDDAEPGSADDSGPRDDATNARDGATSADDVDDDKGDNRNN